MPAATSSPFDSSDTMLWSKGYGRKLHPVVSYSLFDSEARGCSRCAASMRISIDEAEP